ncbi:MAG: knotted carbamoyltransferase YgeW [Armatimonadetes bacterium]|nr:knotted carbamoyltransferase YgeW [Armatimonadota bacterium]
MRRQIQSLEHYENELHDKDFLHTWSYSPATISAVLTTAKVLQQMNQAGISTRLFDTGLGFSIFRDKSTRTRYSFRAGCNMLGLMTEELSEETSQISHGETVRETAAMISFLTEVIGIRDDMFLGEGHKYMKEVAASIQESYDQGVLPQRTAVVNLQCDLDHPTQSLADLRHFCEHFGGPEGLEGRKIAMTWAYSPSYGKPLSVPQGVVSLMSRFGMDVTLAYPEGYDLVPGPLDAARKFAAQSGGSFRVVHSMKEAFKDADIVYPKSWAPMSVMERRTELLRSGKKSELQELEREALARNAEHKDWECTEEMMKVTRKGSALYAHCLPADISGVSCKEGEVAESVFERYRLHTYREAGHKPHVIAAMILLTRFRNPGATIRALIDNDRSRRLTGVPARA